MSHENEYINSIVQREDDQPLADDALDRVSGGDVNGQGGSEVIIGSTGLVGSGSTGPTDLTDGSGGEGDDSSTSMGDGSVRFVRDSVTI